MDQKGKKLKNYEEHEKGRIRTQREHRNKMIEENLQKRGKSEYSMLEEP